MIKTKDLFSLIGISILLITAFTLTNNNSITSPSFTPNVLTYKSQSSPDLLTFPEINQYVDEIGQKLVRVSDFPNLHYEFKVSNNSKPNAWALPNGKVTITRGLIMQIKNEAELAAVLAHEIGHVVAHNKNPPARQSLSPQPQTFSHNNFLIIQIEKLKGLFAKLISSQEMRNEEYQADFDGIRFMSKAGYDTEAAITLQKTFLSHRSTPSSPRETLDLYLFNSHPLFEKRIAINNETIKHYPSSGKFLGEEKYLSILTQLHNSKEAYEKFDRGMILVENYPEEAKKLALEAIELLPNEAVFFDLLGNAETHLKQFQAAIQAYDKAIQLNDNFYEFYLSKGSIEFSINSFNKARQTLEKSTEMSPNPMADYLLGLIDLDDGFLERAMVRLKKASTDRSFIGMEANMMLIHLELSADS